MNDREALVIRMAERLRVYRDCECGHVPCPFCAWPYDPEQPVHEVGCVWIAEELLAAAEATS